MGSYGRIGEDTLLLSISIISHEKIFMLPCCGFLAVYLIYCHPHPAGALLFRRVYCGVRECKVISLLPRIHQKSETFYFPVCSVIFPRIPRGSACSTRPVRSVTQQSCVQPWRMLLLRDNWANLVNLSLSAFSASTLVQDGCIHVKYMN